MDFGLRLLHSLHSEERERVKELGGMAHREEVQQLEAELKAFRDYCRQAGFSDHEMENIYRPLDKIGRNAHLKCWLRILAILVLFLSFVYWLSTLETLQWHISAIGRIIMIKLLPLWNWKPIFYEQCLINKNAEPKEIENLLTHSDCAVCESIASVDHISNTNYETILNQHLIRGAPVIITDANFDWILLKYPETNLTDILFNDERLRDSVPCVLQTNLRIGHQPTDLNIFLSRIRDSQIRNWFVHFQNCNLQAMKALRILAPRPYFLSPHIQPAHFNWLLMSNKYFSPTYKLLELDTGLIIVSQLKGATLIQLSPKSPCENLCPSLTFNLEEGNTLVLANSMWVFEYIPDESSLNVAILSETEWNEA